MVLNDQVIRILKAREEREIKHRQLLEIYQGTLLALTLNIPGQNKTTPDALVAYEAGIRAVDKLFSSRRVNVLKYESSATDDGPHACWIVDTPSPKLKAWTMEIEENHLLGRLFDLDVLDTSGKTLHRDGMGKSQRKCLVCEEPAHACARSRRHDLIALSRAINNMVTRYLEEDDYEKS